MLSEHFTELDVAKVLQERRQKARKKRRILYDCLVARVDDGEDVRCRKRHMFPGRHDGSTDLLSTLRGRTPLICQRCQDYDGDGLGEGEL